MLHERKNLCSHSFVKLYEASQMFVMVDYVGKMTVKKSCRYGKYGSFEHLLFLGFCCCLFVVLFSYNPSNVQSVSQERICFDNSMNCHP